MIHNMSKKIQIFFKNSKKSPKRPKNKIFQKFFKNEFPILILVGFDTLFVKKNSNFFPKYFKNVQKGYQKNKNAPFFDEKCLSRFSNVHSVRIHVQKTLYLRETGGLIPPSPPPGVHVGFKPW